MISITLKTFCNKKYYYWLYNTIHTLKKQNDGEILKNFYYYKKLIFYQLQITCPILSKDNLYS